MQQNFLPREAADRMHASLIHSLHITSPVMHDHVGLWSVMARDLRSWFFRNSTDRDSKHYGTIGLLLMNICVQPEQPHSPFEKKKTRYLNVGTS